jgi:hypothetical protein
MDGKITDIVSLEEADSSETSDNTLSDKSSKTPEPLLAEGRSLSFGPPAIANRNDVSSPQSNVSEKRGSADVKTLASAGNEGGQVGVSDNARGSGKVSETLVGAAPVAGSDGGQRNSAPVEKAASAQGVIASRDSGVHNSSSASATAPEKLASASTNEKSASASSEKGFSSQASGEKIASSASSSSPDVKESSASSASASTSVKAEIDSSSKKQSGGESSAESGGKEEGKGRSKGDGTAHDTKSEVGKSDDEKSSGSKSRSARSESDEDSSPRGRKDKDSSTDGGKSGKESSSDGGKGNKDISADAGKGNGKELDSGKVRGKDNDAVESKSSIRAEASGKTSTSETGMRQSEQAGKVEATDRGIQAPKAGDPKGDGSGIALVDGKMLQDANKIRSQGGSGGVGGGSGGSSFDGRSRKPDKPQSPEGGGGDGRPGRSPGDKTPNDINDKSRGNDKVTLTVDTKTGGKQEVNLADKATQKNMLEAINMVQKGEQNKAERSFPVIAHLVSQFTVRQIDQVKQLLTSAFDAVKAGKANDSAKVEKLTKAEVKALQAEVAKDIALVVQQFKGQSKASSGDLQKELSKTPSLDQSKDLAKDSASSKQPVREQGIARAVESTQNKNQQVMRAEREPIKAQDNQIARPIVRPEDRANVRSDSQPHLRHDAKPDLKNAREIIPGVKPDTRLDSKSEVKKDIARESKSELKSESKTDAHAEIRKTNQPKETFNNRVVREGAFMFDRLIGMIKKTLGDEIETLENRNKALENHNAAVSDLLVKFSTTIASASGPFDDTGPITDERIDQIFEKMQKSAAPDIGKNEDGSISLAQFHGAQERRSYTVQSGDTAHSIARDQLSDPNLVSLICQFNPNLCRMEDINEALPQGMEIVIPNQADINVYKKEHATIS